MGFGVFLIYLEIGVIVVKVVVGVLRIERGFEYVLIFYC